VGAAKKSLRRTKALGWESQGLHSEGGGGRGLTARDAVCIDLILAV